MDKVGGLVVFTKEDVMELLGCSGYLAIKVMKATGKAFKVGKEYRIFLGDLSNFLANDPDNRACHC